MRQLVGAATALVMTVGLSGYAGAASTAKRRAFTQTDVGAQISGSAVKGENVYKVKDSVDGNGAAIQLYKASGTAFPLSGTDTNTAYFGTGVSRSRNTFKLAKPNAKGISVITGTGKCTGGTGRFRTRKCTFTITGTYDTKTGIVHVKLKGFYIG